MFLMGSTKYEQCLKLIQVVENQAAQDEETKCNMRDVLEEAGLEEDDLPQNANLGIALKALMNNEENLFLAVQNLDLDFVKIGEYICFKAEDDVSGTEDIYFISPIEVLYLESGCLSIF